MVVDRGIEFADDVVEHARRESEYGAAIAAVGRMADAIGRSLGKEDGLIDVGGHAAPAEVLAERAVPHEDDVVAVGMFLGRRPAAIGPTVVVAHGDKGALVERAERQRLSGRRDMITVVRDGRTQIKGSTERESDQRRPLFSFPLGTSWNHCQDYPQGEIR